MKVNNKRVFCGGWTKFCCGSNSTLSSTSSAERWWNCANSNFLFLIESQQQRNLWIYCPTLSSFNWIFFLSRTPRNFFLLSASKFQLKITFYLACRWYLETQNDFLCANLKTLEFWPPNSRLDYMRFPFVDITRSAHSRDRRDYWQFNSNFLIEISPSGKFWARSHAISSERLSIRMHQSSTLGSDKQSICAYDVIWSNSINWS